LAATLLLGAGMRFPGAAETTPANQSSSIERGDSLPIYARPANIANAARTVDTGAQGKMVVLREGNNDFTCMPGRHLGYRQVSQTFCGGLSTDFEVKQPNARIFIDCGY
jgi:hypothetical protein